MILIDFTTVQLYIMLQAQDVVIFFYLLRQEAPHLFNPLFVSHTIRLGDFMTNVNGEDSPFSLGVYTMSIA